MDPVMHGGDIYRNRIEHDFSVNTNPLGLPGSVKAEIRDAADLCENYPDIRVEALRNELGDHYGISADHVLCGNGASELLMAIAHGLKPKKTVIPVPSFYGYERAARAMGGNITYYRMPEEKNFALTDEEEIHKLTDLLTDEVDLLFLANPNNPTGASLSPGLMEILLTHCAEKQITVVVDECFMEFMDHGSDQPLVARTAFRPNVIVLRAFTKIFAIPGVRLGYMVCSDRNILDRIGRQLPEWNVSIPAQQAGRAALKEADYLDETVLFVKNEREFLCEGLNRMGIRVYPSEANYLLFKTELPVYERLLNQGILIRDCENFRGLGKGFYRVAVKKREENELLLEAIARIAKEGEKEHEDRDAFSG